MGVYDERIFTFSGRAAGEEIPVAAPSEEVAEMVVVELPPPPASSKNSVPPAPSREEKPKVIERPPSTPMAEAKQPTPPRQAPEEPEIVVVEPKKTQSMAEFVAEMRSGDKGVQSGEADRENVDSSYDSREKTLKTFLDLWITNDPAAMYGMLSASSKKLFPKVAAFESELKKAADFRATLRDGYTIDWLNTERAKVVAVKRFLLIRTLVSRTLGVVRENSTWKILW
jgi:hypothetical protein